MSSPLPPAPEQDPQFRELYLALMDAYRQLGDREAVQVQLVCTDRTCAVGFLPMRGAGRKEAPQPVPVPRHGCAADLCGILRDADRRLTTLEILSECSRRDLPWGESQVKAALATMVDMGILTNDTKTNPKGYTLCD